MSKSKEKSTKKQIKADKKSKSQKKQTKSTSKVRKSKSVDQASEKSDDSGNSEEGGIVYKKDSFVAFIDSRKENDEKFDSFVIGKVSFAELIC